jgi:hypothetical protein
MKMTKEKLRADAEALEQMRKAEYNHEDTRWAAYQNVALDSIDVGRLQFLAIGPQNTFKEPPQRMPDSQHGLGWRYMFVGWVDLETGDVERAER